MPHTLWTFQQVALIVVMTLNAVFTSQILSSTLVTYSFFPFLFFSTP